LKAHGQVGMYDLRTGGGAVEGKFLRGIFVVRSF
jgi:hypothetical protein